jgi:hypothetical protein
MTKRKYSQKAQRKVGKVMYEFKHGKLRSSSGHKVEKRAQAIAIGLSEARERKYKVPPEPKKKRG